MNAPGVREARVRRRKCRVAGKRPLEGLDRLRSRAPVEEEAAPEVEVVCGRVPRCGRVRRRVFAEEPDAERAGDRARDLVLHGEDVVERPVEALRPELVPARHVDELCRHAQAPARLPDAALEDGAHSEALADRANVLGLVLERERGRPGRDAKRLDLHERVDDLLAQPVAEVLAVLLRAQVPEREHGDRGASVGSARRQRVHHGPRHGGLRRAQGKHEVAGRLEPAGRILLEAMSGDLDQGVGEPARGRQSRRLVAKDGGEDLRGRRSGEDAAPDQHFPEHRPEREEVASVVGGKAARLLGRHVRRGAENRPRVGRQRARQGPRVVGSGFFAPGEAEVEELDALVARDEDVFGLEVAVNDALLVRGCESLGDLKSPFRDAARRERPVGEVRPEVCPLQEFGHRVGDAGLLPDVEDREDVRVREGRDGTGLPGEARLRVGVSRERLGQGLDRDLPPEPAVTGAPDLPHPARAERREDDVGPETGAAGQRHGVRILGSRSLHHWK